MSACSSLPAGARVRVIFFFVFVFFIFRPSVTLTSPRVVSSVAAAAGWAAGALVPPSSWAGVSARPVAAVLVASAGAGAGAVFVVARSRPIALALPGGGVGWRARAPAIAVVVSGVYHGGWGLYVRLGVNVLPSQVTPVKLESEIRLIGCARDFIGALPWNVQGRTYYSKSAMA